MCWGGHAGVYVSMCVCVCGCSMRPLVMKFESDDVCLHIASSCH